jgi:hypothetical protein
MRRILSLIATASLLAGCALAQGTLLSDNTARITSRANSVENLDRMIAGAVAEAARLTRAQGYRYFVILEAVDDSKTANVSVNQQITRTTTNTSVRFGNLSLGAIGRTGSTFVTPGSRVQVLRPGLNITIRMYREGEIDPHGQGVWNADGPLLIDPTMSPEPEPPPPRPRRSPSTQRG